MSDGEILGTGSYSTVITTDDPQVVCKKFKDVADSYIYLRECAALRALQHNDHIPKIINIDKDIYMERFSHDLYYFIRNISYTENDIKVIIFQLLLGIYHAHSHGIYHRDIKPQNILITPHPLKVAIGDWGLSRFIDSDMYNTMSGSVQTLWYRAPEVLLHLPYTFAIDMWSCGLVIYELVNKRPLFHGQCNKDQLDRIYQVLGNPDENNWDVDKSLWISPCTRNERMIYELHTDDINLIHLVDRLIQLDPHDRYTVTQALNHSYFNIMRNDKIYSISKILDHYPSGRKYYPHVKKPLMYDISCKKHLPIRTIFLAYAYLDLYMDQNPEAHRHMWAACLSVANLIEEGSDIEFNEYDINLLSQELVLTLNHNLYIITELDYLYTTHHSSEPEIASLIHASMNSSGDILYYDLVSQVLSTNKRQRL